VILFIEDGSLRRRVPLFIKTEYTRDYNASARPYTGQAAGYEKPFSHLITPGALLRPFRNYNKVAGV
jgi:hypothetical protein